MFDEVLEKFVAVVTPDDIREFNRLGCAGKARELLEALDGMAAAWGENGLVSERGLDRARHEIAELMGLLE